MHEALEGPWWCGSGIASRVSGFGFGGWRVARWGWGFLGMGELELVKEGADEQPAGVSCAREAVEVLERGELALDWDGVSRADLNGHVTVSSIDT